VRVSGASGAVTISPPSDLVAPGRTAPLAIRLDRRDLTPGEYAEQLSIAPVDGGIGATVELSYTVSGPTAALSLNETSGTAPVTVTASAKGSTAGSASLTGFTFDWDDGPATQARTDTATHRYTKAGTYSVRVTVTDALGNPAQSRPVTVTVSAPSRPSAVLTVDADEGKVPFTVTADASGSRAGSAAITSYEFHWDDGSDPQTSTNSTAPHTYTAPGRYTITVYPLDALDQQGTGDSVTVSASLAAPKLTAPLGTTLDAYEDATFSWSAVPGATGYKIERECCADDGYANSVSDDETETSTTLDAEGEGTWRWRVWAVGADGQQGPPSDWGTYTVDG
jgi:PKD repeat protein